MTNRVLRFRRHLSLDITCIWEYNPVCCQRQAGICVEFGGQIYL